MSVVIIGGHDRMVCQYKKVCKSFNCKAKVFTQMSATLSKQIGNPDLIVLFTNTVSHKMARCAVEEAERCNADVVRCHSSKQNAVTGDSWKYLYVAKFFYILRIDIVLVS